VTESKLAEEALATINRRLIDAQDDERARIARELHDDINQRLTLVNVRLAAFAQGEPAASTGDLQKINQVREDVQRLSKDLQDLSHRLHPARLEYLGLRAAAAALCREISSQHGVRVSFEAERVPERVSRRIVISLCRVLQEALQNAIKHSGARTIDVSLVGEVDRIQMTVHDGGTGFNPRATLGGGLGLISMKERLTAVHGQLAIESAPQHGTTIRASVPLSQE
jgi:signal transduction histidine kinase